MNQFKISQISPHSDERGKFARTFDIANLELGNFQIAQTSISANPHSLTLRGLHFQLSGPPENKVICLLSGSLFMVIVDLREDSPTYLQKFELELSTPLAQSIYIPSGYATGWISTSPDTSLQYLMSSRFEECTYSGIRFDDKTLAVNWPLQPKIISQQDLSWPTLDNYKAPQ
jgi:dTDP-4-dehydrorhamnose 3,5-epimerase